jgi:hypothetical protein
MNRSDAKMIAEELHKFIRNDVRKAVTEMATAETEEYLNAKMIAEELHKFIRNDVRKAVTEMATAETEEYLNAKQAAVFLGWKLQTLYNRIHDIPHTKNGKSLIFTKSALRKFMERK